MTMALSSLSRLPTTAEKSVRPGTSGMLNRTWHDHPCVVVTWCRKTATTQFKSSGEAASLHRSKPSAGISQLTQTVVTGENAMHQIRHAQSILVRDSSVWGSFSEDMLLSARDQLLLALSFTGGEEGCSGQHPRPSTRTV